MRPRLVIVNGLPPETSADLYNDIAARLCERGIAAEVIHGLSDALASLRECDLVISNSDLSAKMQANVPTYAGRNNIPRPDSLRLLEELNVPTMQWTLAKRRREVCGLFDLWGTERILLKRSFTYGGEGVRVFTRGAVWRLWWKPTLDVFCPEVNPDEGDVYKAELLNGRILMSWKSAAPPIRMLFRRGLHRGLRGAYGERTPWQLPANLAALLSAVSRRLTSDGLSHISVDLMRRPNGELVAIELNTGSIATWWTRQYAEFRREYTEALYELAIRHGLNSDGPNPCG